MASYRHITPHRFLPMHVASRSSGGGLSHATFWSAACARCGRRHRSASPTTCVDTAIDAACYSSVQTLRLLSVSASDLAVAAMLLQDGGMEVYSHASHHIASHLVIVQCRSYARSSSTITFVSRLARCVACSHYCPTDTAGAARGVHHVVAEQSLGPGTGRQRGHRR